MYASETAGETAGFDGPPRLPSLLGMAGASSHGRGVAARFNLDAARTAVTTSLKRGQIAVTRLTGDAVASEPLPAERAYAVMLQLRDCPPARLLKAGRVVPTAPFVAGSIVVGHLADEPAFELGAPFDMLLIHIPQVVLDELAEDHGAPPIAGFADQLGATDPIVHHLGRALAPMLEADGEAPSLLFDHVAFAIHARLATLYGEGQPRAEPAVGALSPGQMRAAKAALTADLSEDPALADVARACGVPAGRFVRAFRLATGTPPHRWLRGFRIERAKELMLGSSLSLGQIAYDCGFADQSHFTRVFAATVGDPPGAWRRARRG